MDSTIVKEDRGTKKNGPRRQIPPGPPIHMVAAVSSNGVTRHGRPPTLALGSDIPYACFGNQEPVCHTQPRRKS